MGAFRELFYFFFILITLVLGLVYIIPLLPKHPLEFYGRVITFLEVQLESLFSDKLSRYKIKDLQVVALELEKAFGMKLFYYLNEQALKEIENKLIQKTDMIHSISPFSLLHNAGFTLARVCYVICRMIRPNIVLETGVANGVTSAFILKALEVNGKGVLHSIDLPPLARDADSFVGNLIPEELKIRWSLHRGVSKIVLPSLLHDIGFVDLFVHDSLHTLRNMRREFKLVTPYLSAKSAVIADDIDLNSAFQEWMDILKPEFWTVIREQEKENLFGIGIKRNAYTHHS